MFQHYPNDNININNINTNDSSNDIINRNIMNNSNIYHKNNNNNHNNHNISNNNNTDYNRRMMSNNIDIIDYNNRCNSNTTEYSRRNNNNNSNIINTNRSKSDSDYTNSKNNSNNVDLDNIIKFTKNNNNINRVDSNNISIKDNTHDDKNYNNNNNPNNVNTTTITTNNNKNNNNMDNNNIESAEDYRKRWRSIRIVYFTMLFDSLSFSLVLASLWPYLQKVNKGQPLNPIYLGWANVGFHISGIIVDFIMGLWTNRRGSMEPLLVSLVVFGCGNFLYTYAEACGEYGVTMVIVSRGVIGLSTGVNVIARSAISDATTLGERTTALAHMSLAEGIGFTFGPAVQLLSIPLGDDGIYLPSLKLNLNLYTAPAFICTFVAFINILLILGYYYEHRIDIYRDMRTDTDTASFHRLLEQSRGRSGGGSFRFDHIAVVIVLGLYFVAQSAFALYETILPPLTMDMLAWSRTQTATYASLLFLCAGIIAIFAFAASEILEKKSSDKLILFVGFAFIFLGYATHLPWGDEYPKLATNPNTTVGVGNHSNILVPHATPGCPSDEYHWCTTSPKISLHQIILGTIFLSVGYPFVMVLTSSMYSKILGPSPQGVMQSWYGAVGGLARIVSPLLVTYLYANFAPRWTFVSVDSLVVLAVVVLLCTYRRLIPYHLYVLHKRKDDIGDIIVAVD